MTISSEDLAWVAGFLEGEGSFALSNGSSSPHAYARVSAYQVQRWPIDRLAAILGGKITQRPARGNQQPCWVWNLHGTAAREVMVLLRPHLSPKRQSQIDIALDGERIGPDRRALTVDDVLLIRASGETGVALARRLGVSASLISQVRRRQVWKHVAAPVEGRKAPK